MIDAPSIGRFVLAIVLGILLAWGFGTFVAWTPDVTAWPGTGRFFMLTFGIVAGVYAFAIYEDSRA